MNTLLDRYASAKRIQRTIRDRQDALVRAARSIIAEAETPATDEHADWLKRLGFTGSNAVREQDRIRSNAEKMRTDMERHEEYAMKYPGFRFVSEAVMKAVCEKYKLVIGEVDRYLGDVPEWAAKVVENSGVQAETYNVCFKWSSSNHGWASFPTASEARTVLNDRFNRNPDLEIRRVNTLLIAAPKRLMRINAREKVRGHRIVRRDPIVMVEVPGGYIVLAAWDEEGRDPRILNPGNN
jgi:hypothetical protein